MSAHLDSAPETAPDARRRAKAAGGRRGHADPDSAGGSGRTVEPAPSFTIVIPTRGRPEPLERCLHALSRLDYSAERHEVVVVDDGSHEPVAQRLASLCANAGARVVRQERKGPAAARNAGARVARGEFIAFLDDDCEPSADWLLLLASRLEEAPDGAIGGRIVNALPAKAGSTANQLHADYMQGRHLDKTVPPRFLPSNNLAVATHLFSELGGFDESFRIAGSEDRDFCDRWVATGRPLLLEPTAVVLHAHPVDLAGFVRKHFEYGRGAFRFRRARARRHGDRLRLEPPRFYAGLVLTPFRHDRRARSALLAALLVVSQLANAAGFLAEGLRRRGGGRES
jgi:glycosyltransferase involved in cell wall biosynthesis